MKVIKVKTVKELIEKLSKDKEGYIGRIVEIDTGRYFFRHLITRITNKGVNWIRLEDLLRNPKPREFLEELNLSLETIRKALKEIEDLKREVNKAYI